MPYHEKRLQCPKCGSILATDITTYYDKDTDEEKCKNCGYVFQVIPDQKKQDYPLDEEG